MLLSKAEMQRSRAFIATAFPHFAAWEVANEVDDNHPGFCIWGCYVPESKVLYSPRFFVTFETFNEYWRGHLTVGKPCYFWSSADVGDAYLLDTEKCASLEEATRGLKRRIADLFASLSR